MSKRSYFAGRSADLIFILKPYISDRQPFGVNHGTPWDYDTHVPLLWYGQGIKAQVVTDPVSVDDLAPTLSALLQIPRPPQARGRRLF
jgi:arylsulfatase A-like enzyme